MDTQYRKNLKAVLTASKDYTDNSIEKLKWELGTYDLSVTTDSTVAYTKTIPTNTIKGRLNYIGGASKVSENLVDVANAEKGADLGVTLTVNADKSITIVNSNSESKRITFNSTGILNKTISISFKSNSTAGRFAIASLSISQNYVNGLNKIENIAYNNNVISFYVDGNTTLTISEIMFNKGSTALPYEPYFENIRSAKTTSVVASGTDVAPITKAIPQEVLNDVRYGLGFSDTQFNKLDLITKHLTGEWNIVDLGSLNWQYYAGETNTFIIYSVKTNQNMKLVSSNNVVPNIITSKYETNTLNILRNADSDKMISIAVFDALVIKDKTYDNNVNAFKEAMSGVYLLYQTETQFDVDFSQYIDDDFKNIDTTDMTTATFENEFGYDVPSEIDYLIEEVKA